MPSIRDIAARLARPSATVACAAGLLAVAASPAFGFHPWLARRPPAQPPAAHQLMDVGRWPNEPASPAEIDPERFRISVEHLCARRRLASDPARPTSLPATAATDARPATATAASAKPAATAPNATSGGATAPIVVALPTAAKANPATPPAGAVPAGASTLGDPIRAAAADAGIDPFLLAGLVFAQSGCHADVESPLGMGLLRISPALYHSPGAPPPPGERADWSPRALLDPASNLRLGAQLLRMWQDTHVERDDVFRGVPHRGPVAHFIWGDVVHGSGGEDQALTARRRLIAFYASAPEPAAPTSLGVTLISPLEGAPRVASSGPGEDRAGGRRRHRGLDLVAAIGEPVRVVADGTVIFAGANLPSAPRRMIPPRLIDRYRWRRLGPGGIYVCIEHAPERHIVTCYMHLDTYIVSEGEAVTAGQEIGRVGRTGVQVSPPHLHFELRVDDRHMDPARYLGDMIIPPKATQTHRYAVAAQRMRLARTRAARNGT